MTETYFNKKFQKKEYYGNVHTPFAEECLAFLAQQKLTGKHILDLGCGQGQDSTFFAEQGYSVTALDFSAEALKSIQDKRIEKVQEDMCNLHIFADNSFDIVYASFSLHFFTKEEFYQILVQINRVLKPTGFFLFNLKNKNDKYYGKGTKIADDSFVCEGVIRSFYSEEETKALFRQSGFVVLSFAEGLHVHTMRDTIPTAYWKVHAQAKKQS